MGPNRRTTAIVLGLLLLVTTGLLSASTGGGYDLNWWTIDSGGATFSSGGDFTLGGTIGQPDAGPVTGPMIGGDFALTGGFWNKTHVKYKVYLPLVLR